jgi:Protein of unknown function (DUF3592)
MAANFLIDAISSRLQRRNREKKLVLAAQWPTTQAEINHWAVQPADKEHATTGTPYQIEAGFHFKVNGEYFGGYLRSVALTHHQAEINAKGSPTIHIRYNPTNPDQTAVLAEENTTTLPFPIISG